MAKYRKIDLKVWGNRDFLALSPYAKLVWFQLNSHPNLKALGWLRSSTEGLAAEIGLDHQGYLAALDELGDRVAVDRDLYVVWLRYFLDDNLPESPNVIRAWALSFQDFPDSSLACDLLDAASRHCGKFRETFERDFAPWLTNAEFVRNSVSRCDAEIAAFMSELEDVKNRDIPDSPDKQNWINNRMSRLKATKARLDFLKILDSSLAGKPRAGLDLSDTPQDGLAPDDLSDTPQDGLAPDDLSDTPQAGLAPHDLSDTPQEEIAPQYLPDSPQAENPQAPLEDLENSVSENPQAPLELLENSGVENPQAVDEVIAAIHNQKVKVALEVLAAENRERAAKPELAPSGNPAATLAQPCGRAAATLLEPLSIKQFKKSSSTSRARAMRDDYGVTTVAVRPDRCSASTAAAAAGQDCCSASTAAAAGQDCCSASTAAAAGQDCCSASTAAASPDCNSATSGQASSAEPDSKAATSGAVSCSKATSSAAEAGGYDPELADIENDPPLVDVASAPAVSPGAAGSKAAASAACWDNHADYAPPAGGNYRSFGLVDPEEADEDFYSTSACAGDNSSTGYFSSDYSSSASTLVLERPHLASENAPVSSGSLFRSPAIGTHINPLTGEVTARETKAASLSSGWLGSILDEIVSVKRIEGDLPERQPEPQTQGKGRAERTDKARQAEKSRRADNSSSSSTAGSSSIASNAGAGDEAVKPVVFHTHDGKFTLSREMQVYWREELYPEIEDWDSIFRDIRARLMALGKKAPDLERLPIWLNSFLKNCKQDLLKARRKAEREREEDDLYQECLESSLEEIRSTFEELEAYAHGSQGTQACGA